MTDVWLFRFAPSKIYKFCKAFQQDAFHQISFILWFFGLKTFYGRQLPSKKLFIKKIPENHDLLLLKNPVTVEWILAPIPYFCNKSKEYLDFDKNSNLETYIFFWFYKEWNSVRLELLTSICVTRFQYIIFLMPENALQLSVPVSDNNNLWFIGDTNCSPLNWTYFENGPYTFWVAWLAVE